MEYSPRMTMRGILSVIIFFLVPLFAVAQLEYVKELYLEGMQPDKVYYLRQIRRNFKQKDQAPVWLINIGEEGSLKDDKADGSSVVLSYYSNKNVENMGVIPLQGKREGLKGYICINWDLLPAGKEVCPFALLDKNKVGSLDENPMIHEYIRPLDFMHTFQIPKENRLIEKQEQKTAPQIVSFKPRSGKKIRIKITSQQEFDSLAERIRTALIEAPALLEIQFAEGMYTFHENQIDLQNLNFPETSLKLVGNKAVITAIGFQRDADMGSKTEMSPDTVEIVDQKDKLCRIRLNSSPLLTPKKLQLTEWYLTRFYEVESVKDGWCYFHAPELFYMNSFFKQWNVNWDKGYGEKNPRYRLFYKENPCKEGRVLNLKNSRLHQILIEGVTFVGNGGQSNLMDFHKVSTQGILIQNCLFQDLHTRVLYASHTPYITFQRNRVERGYSSCIFSGPGCEGTIVQNNIFYDNSRGLNNTVDVTMYSPNFYVSNNTFHNFHYAALSIGYNWGAPQQDRVTGIVEGNEMFQDSTFIADYQQYTLMDGGAIYISTRLDDVVIRYNSIHDVKGMKDNRGIFCDDGAKNLKIYGNVISGIHNSYCVDSRLVESVAGQVEDYNTGNLVMYNLMAGSYKFEGRRDSLENNICSSNFVAMLRDAERPEKETHNLSSEGKDYMVEQLDSSSAGLYISKRYRKLLTSCPVWKGMSRWVSFGKE
ncbi:MAG: right-handed parallel beta-helix repeat-containing protein [Bacteroidaceae bacterium]|nr:right-handed parallel beta-helix repeat-containing protein [Bacteroidaceae bacterium]